ncbi:hypothetical protein HCG49_18135 [Arenibacter sp. 6A1]|nr:hypothetical protein [Arenibacter sp. 6A1]NKI28474.1 hypothetical protein [Arenibacter sp. 6A1]
MNDARIKARLYIKVIAFSDGVEMYKKATGYQELSFARIWKNHTIWLNS